MECSYRVTEAALTYMNEQGLSEAIRQRLLQETPTEISTRKNWQRHLDALKIEDERHLRIATEGALLGGLLEKGVNPELAIISDGPGQFAILLHGVCWIHAERLIHKLIPMNDLQRDAIATVRDLEPLRRSQGVQAATRCDSNWRVRVALHRHLYPTDRLRHA